MPVADSRESHCERSISPLGSVEDKRENAYLPFDRAGNSDLTESGGEIDGKYSFESLVGLFVPPRKHMGAKTWMLVYADGNARNLLAAKPRFDRDATLRLATELFPKDGLEPIEDVSLYYTCPPDDEITIGCFPGLSIVAAAEFGIDYPSQLPPRFLIPAGARTVYLHAMHSVVDFFAFAVWHVGRLERSLSLSPDSGLMEDIGPRLPFEEPYWSGEHPAVDPDDEDEDEPPYPFPFHPLDLGEAALKEFFGYQIEGELTNLDPESIPLASFKRTTCTFKP
jgi:hypothetical protein